MISEKAVEAACVAFLWHYGTDLERRHFGCDPDDGHTPETLWSAASEDEREGIRKFMRPALAAALSLHMGRLKAEQVEWVVNDIAELGVKIGDQFFWLYKGRSLVYGDDEESQKAGVALWEDGDEPLKPHTWRPVFKREFGECAHPINYADPTKIGTVSPDDSDEWKPLPAAHIAEERRDGQ